VQQVQEQVSEIIDTSSSKELPDSFVDDGEKEDDAPELEQVDIEEVRNKRKIEWLERLQQQEAEQTQKTE
jgi:type II secretory pathway component PulM